MERWSGQSSAGGGLWCLSADTDDMVSKGLATGIGIDGLLQACSQAVQDLLLRGRSDGCGSVGCRKDEVNDFGGWSTSSSLSGLCRSERSCEQENRNDASLDHLRPQHRVTLRSRTILHAHQRAATIEEMIKVGNEAVVALGERLASTYAAQADTPPEDDQPRQQLKEAPQTRLGRKIDDISPLLKILLL